MPAAAAVAGAGMLELGAFGSADDLATLGADAIKAWAYTRSRCSST
jgi:hypothetical protein